MKVLAVEKGQLDKQNKVSYKTAGNKMFLQWRGSVSSLLSFSLFKLCRGTGRNWSALAFRFAPLLRPPIPATAETQTLWARLKDNNNET